MIGKCRQCGVSAIVADNRSPERAGQRIAPETSARIRLLSLVCVLLVVAIHTTWMSINCPFWNRVTNGVLSIAVPYFFVVSGYFLAARATEDGWWKRAVRRRVVSLGVPYVCWLVAALLVIASVDVTQNLLAHQPVFSHLRAFGGSGRIFFGLNLWHYPGVVPLWYLRCLFLFVLAAPVLVWCVKRLSYAWIALLFAMAVVVSVLGKTGVLSPQRGGWGFFLSYGISVSGLFFYSVGMLLRIKPQVQRLGDGRVALALAGCVVLVLWLVPVCAKLPSIVASAALLYVVWRMTPACPLPADILSSAFPIYLMHAVVFEAFWPIAAGIGLDNWPLAYGCAMWLVGVLVPMGIAFVLRRSAPRLAGWLFGGR